MALETTVETILANVAHRADILVATSVSKSFLLTEAELTTLAAVTLGGAAVAVMKAVQVFDHAGCASLQFAHFAFALSLL